MTQIEEQPRRRTYRGNCHCGAFVYEIDLPELDTVIDCDCSFCSRKGHLYVQTSEDANFRVVKGSEEKLTSYTFGAASKIHKFCPKCATSLLSRMPNGAPHLKLLLNARAMQDVDIRTLQRRHVFYSKINSQYLPPEHKGDIPPSIEGGRLYMGSCHCGAVTLALTSKPLDESSEERAAECNCNICQRNAYVWLRPKPEHVVLSGPEDAIGRYVFADGLTSKTFCRTCGVNMTNIRNELPEEEVLALSEQARQIYWRGKATYPVNARVLHGVDVGKLKKVLFDGATLMPSTYVNPNPHGKQALWASIRHHRSQEQLVTRAYRDSQMQRRASSPGPPSRGHRGGYATSFQAGIVQVPAEETNAAKATCGVRMLVTLPLVGGDDLASKQGGILAGKVDW
ncbi:glutathione-dependent formaldehyde-activating enzyme [Trichoderma arundinaceum]|uniref:Glutathione-dependent formaldehyde-activating enzyme n=1 Tax=Trichoderma arundinaceum TaxID=490622 RepID=A0A395NR48_TRIAR|nr:glutathione-dependent formaldehyde-activating enzyme [Trichoderma arundinaceum]